MILHLTELVCKKCGKLKPYYEFFTSTKAKRGYTVFCKTCSPRKTRNVMKIERKPRQAHENEKAKAIAAYYIENPKALARDVAEATGIPERTVYYYQKTNSYLKALRTLASNRVTNFIPKALNAVDESLNSQNADVKFKSAVKILENEKVFVKEGTEIIVNNLANLPVATLKEIAAQAQDIPEQTIMEAEIV